MPATNILVLVHGMTSHAQPSTHEDDYNLLTEGLFLKQPALSRSFATIARVEWGHRPPHTPSASLRPDQRLTDAENTIHRQVSYQTLQKDESPQNYVLGAGSEIFSKLVTRRITDPIKETALLYGVTDVFYYCAPDGEDAVRYAVYKQVLDSLQPFRGEVDVRLHIIGHSLGVTVAYDFLFGLFAPVTELSHGIPGFFGNTIASEEDKANYEFWRNAVHDHGTLRLGSKASTAGQLPLTMMRKQKLVNRLAQRKSLDPTVIGLPHSGPVKWRMFYDVDDVLGFPARRLFDQVTTIEEFQVDTDWRPDLSHSSYWSNSKVLEQIANLLMANVT